MLGISCLVMSVGAFICVVPNLMVGPYDYDGLANESRSHTCDTNERNLTMTYACDEKIESYEYFLITGTLLVGMGAAPFFTMGISKCSFRFGLGPH